MVFPGQISQTETARSGGLMEILIIIVGCYVAIGLVFGLLSKSPWVGLLWPVLIARLCPCA